MTPNIQDTFEVSITKLGMNLRTQGGVGKVYFRFSGSLPVFREIGKNLLTQPFLHGF